MIGVLVKTDLDIEALNKDWIPNLINAKLLNQAFLAVLGYIPQSEKFCHKSENCMIHFTVDDLNNPRSLSFNCTLTETASEIIKKISDSIGTKIYCGEECDFIEL